jgi:hypothetical protein
MCLLIFIFFVPLMLIFAAPFFAVFFGVNLFVNAADKKKYGDEAEKVNKERGDHVAQLTAFWSIVLLILFIALYLLT